MFSILKFAGVLYLYLVHLGVPSWRRRKLLVGAAADRADSGPCGPGLVEGLHRRGRQSHGSADLRCGAATVASETGGMRGQGLDSLMRCRALMARQFVFREKQPAVRRRISRSGCRSFSAFGHRAFSARARTGSSPELPSALKCSDTWESSLRARGRSERPGCPLRGISFTVRPVYGRAVTRWPALARVIRALTVSDRPRSRSPRGRYRPARCCGFSGGGELTRPGEGVSGAFPGSWCPAVAYAFAARQALSAMSAGTDDTFMSRTRHRS